MTDAAEPEITGTPTAWDRVKLARETDRPTPGITRRVVHGRHRVPRRPPLRRRPRADGRHRRLPGHTVMVIGIRAAPTPREHQPQLGMPRRRVSQGSALMQHAEKFGLPILTFIDTPAPTGHQLGGARAGHRHRRQPDGDVRPPRADRLHGDRRGRLRRRAGDRRRRPPADAGERDLRGRSPKPAPRSSGATSPRRRRPPRPCASPPPTAGLGIVDEFVPEPTPAHEAPREVIAATGEHIARALDEVMASWDLRPAPASRRCGGALNGSSVAMGAGAMAAWRRGRGATVTRLVGDMEALIHQGPVLRTRRRIRDDRADPQRHSSEPAGPMPRSPARSAIEPVSVPES